jgi:acyl transferase domain-containing protein
MGHSFGEIAALTCAGVFSPEDGAEIVCDRAESLALRAPRDGRMAAISASRQKVYDALDQFSSTRGHVPLEARLQIAVENSDVQTVISGAREEIELFIPQCTQLGLSARALNSPFAFHHASLGIAGMEFSRRLGQRATAAPKCPVYSPILGRYYRADDDFQGLLAMHLTQPVNFSAAVRRLRSEGVDTFIECGALDALTKNVIRVLGPGNGHVFPTLGHTADDLSHAKRIVNHFTQKGMNTTAPSQTARPDFETFWRDRSPIIMSQLKAEFLNFLKSEGAPATPIPTAPSPSASAAPTNGKSTPTATPAVSAPRAYGNPASAAPAAATPATVNGKPKTAVPREKLFGELVAVYAEAMEYPHEVFTESVELEAELGIDSVKQSEIIRRISTQYHLPPPPANFRAGDFKTMGQIVDFVFAHQGKASA